MEWVQSLASSLARTSSVLLALLFLAITTPPEALAATVGDVAWKHHAQRPDQLTLEAQIYLEKGDKHVQVYLRRVAIEGGQARDLTIHNLASKKTRPHLEQSCSGRFFEVREAEVKTVAFEVSRADLTGDGLKRLEEAALLLEIESRGKIVLSLQVDRPSPTIFADQTALRLAPVGPSLTQEELQAFELELDSRLKSDPTDQGRQTSRARISVSFDSKLRRRAIGETIVESICFVTNRAKSKTPPKSKKWADTFTSEPSESITFGRVEVTIPAQVITGRLNSKAAIPVDPLIVTPKEELTDFNYESLQDLLANSADDDVIVYIHGYNNTFEEALQRAAQLKHELNFEGSVIAFCWPSLGETFVTRSIEAAKKDPSLMDRMVSPMSKPYLRDWGVAAQSQPALTKLLRELLERRRQSGGSARIHLLAHSMGNRVALGSLHQLELSGAFCDQSEPIENLVLLAPDVSVEEFGRWRESAARASRRMTHYYSTEDVPLMLSQKVNRDRRAGLCQVNCAGSENYDTVCVDEVNSYFSGLGHLYYGNSRVVLRDLYYLVVMGMPATGRAFHLEALPIEQEHAYPVYRFTKDP